MGVAKIKVFCVGLQVLTENTNGATILCSVEPPGAFNWHNVNVIIVYFTEKV
jgi:hypothetical protein